MHAWGGASAGPGSVPSSAPPFGFSLEAQHGLNLSRARSKSPKVTAALAAQTMARHNPVSPSSWLVEYFQASPRRATSENPSEPRSTPRLAYDSHRHALLDTRSPKPGTSPYDPGADRQALDRRVPAQHTTAFSPRREPTTCPSPPSAHVPSRAGGQSPYSPHPRAADLRPTHPDDSVHGVWAGDGYPLHGSPVRVTQSTRRRVVTGSDIDAVVVEIDTEADAGEEDAASQDPGSWTPAQARFSRSGARPVEPAPVFAPRQDPQPHRGASPPPSCMPRYRCVTEEVLHLEREVTTPPGLREAEGARAVARRSMPSPPAAAGEAPLDAAAVDGAVVQPPLEDPGHSAHRTSPIATRMSEPRKPMLTPPRLRVHEEGGAPQQRAPAPVPQEAKPTPPRPERRDTDPLPDTAPPEAPPAAFPAASEDEAVTEAPAEADTSAETEAAAPAATQPPATAHKAPPSPPRTRSGHTELAIQKPVGAAPPLGLRLRPSLRILDVRPGGAAAAAVGSRPLLLHSVMAANGAPVGSVNVLHDLWVGTRAGDVLTLTLGPPDPARHLSFSVAKLVAGQPLGASVSDRLVVQALRPTSAFQGLDGYGGVLRRAVVEVNGKKVASVAALKQGWDAAPVGSSVAFKLSPVHG